MMNTLNSFLDIISDYLARRKGLLPLIGILLIGINFILQVFQLGWISSTDLFLHLGIIIAILGFMIAWAL